MGLAQPLGALWDSRRQLSLPGPSRTNVFPRIYLRPWDSQSHRADTTETASTNELKFLKWIRRGWMNSFGKPKDYALIMPPVGCQWTIIVFWRNSSGRRKIRSGSN